MARTALPKILGGCSILFGIGVLVASSCFLYESSNQRCIQDFQREYKDQFEHKSRTGGTHGGTYYNPRGPPPHYQHYKLENGVEALYESNVDSVPNSGYSQQWLAQPPQRPTYDQHSGSRGYENEYSQYCSTILRKYKTCAIIGIVCGIIQILASTLYCFATKTSIKALSGIWAGIHFVIVITLVVIGGVVLGETSFEADEKNLQDYSDYNYKNPLYTKKLAFAIMSLVDSCILILVMIFIGISWKKNDYEDYSLPGDDGHEIGTRKRKVLQS